MGIEAPRAASCSSHKTPSLIIAWKTQLYFLLQTSATSPTFQTSPQFFRETPTSPLTPSAATTAASSSNNVGNPTSGGLKQVYSPTISGHSTSSVSQKNTPARMPVGELRFLHFYAPSPWVTVDMPRQFPSPSFSHFRPGRGGVAGREVKQKHNFPLLLFSRRCRRSRLHCRWQHGEFPDAVSKLLLSLFPLLPAYRLYARTHARSLAHTQCAAARARANGFVRAGGRAKRTRAIA